MVSGEWAKFGAGRDLVPALWQGDTAIELGAGGGRSPHGNRRGIARAFVVIHPLGGCGQDWTVSCAGGSAVWVVPLDVLSQVLMPEPCGSYFCQLVT